MRNPQPGATYHVVAELTKGLGDRGELLDRHEFDLTLEFRNPESGEPGFGFGVDWDEVKRKAADAVTLTPCPLCACADRSAILANKRTS